MILEHNRGRSRQRGSAMLCSLILGVSCAALAAAMINKNVATKLTLDANWAAAERLYIARAAVASGYEDIRSGGTGAVGSVNAPLRCGDGAAYVESAANPDGTFTLTSHGTYGGYWRAVQAIVHDVGKPTSRTTSSARTRPRTGSRSSRSRTRRSRTPATSTSATSGSARWSRWTRSCTPRTTSRT